MATMEEYKKFRERYDKHGYYGFVKPEEENKINIKSTSSKPSIIDETISGVLGNKTVTPFLPQYQEQLKKDEVRRSQYPTTEVNNDVMPLLEKSVALSSPLLDSASFFVKPILEKKYAPDFYEMQQQAKAKHPYLSAIGNVGGYLLPGTLIAKGVKAGTTALKSIPFVSNIASKAFPGVDIVGKAANLGLYAGAEGVGLGAMEGTAEGIREGYSATDTVKNALSKAKEYGEAGLVLGPALSSLGLLGKNQFSKYATNKSLNQMDDAYNTMARDGIASFPKVNTNIPETIPLGTLSSQLQMQAEKIAPKIDAYITRFPQIKEPKITSDVPLRYKPLPKIEEPLMLNAPKGTYLKQQAGEGKSFTMRPIETTGTVKEYKFQRNPVSKKEVLPETNENLSDWSIDDIADENEFWKSFGSDNIASKSSKFVKGIDDRNFENVGDRIVKSIQHERPELKSFIQQEASRLLQELKGSIKGKRYPVFEEDGYIREYVGDKRFTSESIERILDNLPNKPTYQEIEDAIQKIIRDGGAENNALSKRIELIIDDNLSKGTNSIDQIPLPPNKLYNALKTGEVSDAIPKNVNILRRVQNEKEITKNVIPSIKEKLQNINNSRNPYYVQPEFRKEIAGDPTRPIKLPPVVNATKNEAAQSIVSPPKVKGNMKSPSTNKNATEAIVEPNRPIQANEILKNKEIDTNVVPIKKSQQYSSEIQEKLDAANAKYKLDSQRIKENKIMDAVQKSKRLKGLGEQHSANKRNIIQGDSLIPVEGGLTSKELNAKISKLKSNYAGKEVFTPDGEGIVTGQSSFGKVGVKIDGIVKYYPKEKIQPKVDVDEIIKQQKESQSQVFNTSNNVPGKMEAAEPIIETPIPKQPKTQTAQTPPTNTNNADVGTGNMKNRQFIENSYMNSDVPTTAMKENMATKIPKYEQISNKKTLEEAQRIVDSDYEGSVRDFLKSDKLNDAIDTAKGEVLIQRAIEKGKYAEADDIALNLAKKLTTAGQTIQAASIMKRMTPEGMLKHITKTIDDMNGKKLTPEQIKGITDNMKLVQKAEAGELTLLDINLQMFAARNKSLTETLKELAKSKGDEILDKLMAKQISDAALDNVSFIAANNLPVTKMDKINAWRRMAMLANPKTHIKNFSGNVIMAALRKTSDTLAAGLEKVIIKDGQRTKSVGWSKDKDIVKAVNDDWEWYKNDLKKGGKFDLDTVFLNQEKPIFEKGRITKYLESKTGKTYDYGIMESLNQVSRDALNASDNIFLQRAYKDALGGYMKANGLKTVTNEARLYAARRGYEAVFKQANEFSNWISRMKAKGGATGAVLEAKIPFSKTPSNIVMRGVEYSPAGLIKALYSKSKGKGAADVIEDLAKGLTGTAIYGLGLVLGSMGWAKTESSKSKALQSVESDVGAQPYSITTPLGSYSFEWSQPTSIPFAMGVATMESILKKNKNEDDIGISEMIMKSMAAGGDTLFNTTMLRNVMDMFGGKYGSPTEALLSVPDDYIQQSIPSMLGQLTRSIDPVKRDTSGGFVDVVKSKIPFLSSTLPAKIDAYGREVKQPGALQQFFSPGYLKLDSGDKTSKELIRLNKATGETKFLPQVGAEKITYQTDKNQPSKTLILPPKLKETYARVLGQANKAELDNVINSSKYINAETDKDRVKQLDSALNKVKETIDNQFLNQQGIQEYVSSPSSSSSGGRTRSRSRSRSR